MSVIGRLDEQVEAVLITPLKGKRDPEETNTPATREEFPKRETERQTGAENRGAREREQLPVWLL